MSVCGNEAEGGEILLSDFFQPMIYDHHGPAAGSTTGMRLCDGPGGYLELQANGSYRYGILTG